MKKRILSVILATAMVFAILATLAVGASAISSSYTATEIAVAAELAAAVANFETEYVPTVDFSVDILDNIMEIVKYEYPILFQISHRLSYSYTVRNGVKYVTRMLPDYVMTAEEYTIARENIEEWADKITSLADPDFTDLEYAFFFSDYLCANYVYDKTTRVHDLPTFVREGIGVCEAYTFAYSILLENVGIEASFARSDDMNHVWNLVELDGQWYHADITWNDPDSGRGIAWHDDFLKSDAAFMMAENPHYNWESIYSCGSDLYDNAFFADVQSSYAYVDGKWYYVHDHDLYVTDDITAAGKIYLGLNMYWPVWGKDGYIYINSFSGIVSYDDCLYLNTENEIICVDTADKTYHTVYEYTAGDGYIYGFSMDLGEDGVEYADYSSGIAKVSIATTPGKELKAIKVKLYDVLKISIGDVDGDGEVLMTDVAALARYLAGAEVTITDGADVNGDGDVTVTDLSSLRRILA